MQNEKYLELDALAAPDSYVAPLTKEDLAYELLSPKDRPSSNLSSIRKKWSIP